MTRKENTYGTANLNMLSPYILSLKDPYSAWQFIVNTNAHIIRAAKEMGYQGIERHPIRTINTLLRRNPSDEEKDGTLSQHQSFRSEETIRDVLNHKNPIFALASIFLLPERLNSIKVCADYQRWLEGNKLPITLYENGIMPNDPNLSEFDGCLVQPTPELMEHVNAHSVEELVDETDGGDYGYTGFCLDLYHIRDPHNEALSNFGTSLPKLLERAPEIHVAAGRTDMNRIPHDTTMNDLAGLMHGTIEDTELGKMLAIVAENDWKGLVITEIPSGPIGKILKNDGTEVTHQSMVDAHHTIVESIRSILE